MVLVVFKRRPVPFVVLIFSVRSFLLSDRPWLNLSCAQGHEKDDSKVERLKQGV